MRVAGIRLRNGSIIWGDAGLLDVEPMDTVTARIGDREEEGSVFVAPQHWAYPPPAVQGVLVKATRRSRQVSVCQDLPFADLSPLGSMMTCGSITGQVTSVDVVNRILWITDSDGAVHEVAVESNL